MLKFAGISSLLVVECESLFLLSAVVNVNEKQSLTETGIGCQAYGI